MMKRQQELSHHWPLALVLTALGSASLLISLGVHTTHKDDAQCSSFNHNFISQNFRRDTRGCVATCSFVFATSLRTAIMTPLTRLQEKQQAFLQPLNWTLETMGIIADAMEDFSHTVWEDVARDADVLNDNAVSSFTQPPEIDLNASVPCDYGNRKKYLLEGPYEELPQGDREWCQLRDVITRDVLIEYASAHFDTNFDLSTHPIILRNAWSPESFRKGRRRLTPTGILNDPALSNTLLPNYFLDAAETGYKALVPDASQITLSQFLINIQSGGAPRSKIGTQVIIEEHPELRAEIFNVSMAKELFSWSENPKELLEGWFDSRWLNWLPPMSYYPIFIADNKLAAEQSSYPRTDLHAEPIGNIAVQLHGVRRWTLVATKWSKLLKPTVSRHGRAYVFSNMDPQHELPKRLKSLPLVYECVTKRGDALWVPPWMWHRVDYAYTEATNFDEDDTLSLGASIFHFFPKLFTSNSLFAFLIVPNLFWEVIGLNVE